MSTTGTVTTTTTTPPATTVSASAGFTPLSQEPGYVPKKRSLEDVLPAIRGRLAQPLEGRAAVVIKCPAIGGPKQFSPALYPTSTLCGTLVQAITTTTKTYTATTKTTTTLAPSTITSTVNTQNSLYCACSRYPFYTFTKHAFIRPPPPLPQPKP